MTSAGNWFNSRPHVLSELSGLIAQAPPPAGIEGLMLSLSNRYSAINGNAIAVLKSGGDTYSTTSKFFSFYGAIQGTVEDLIAALNSSYNASASRYLSGQLHGSSAPTPNPIPVASILKDWHKPSPAGSLPPPSSSFSLPPQTAFSLSDPFGAPLDDPEEEETLSKFQLVYVYNGAHRVRELKNPIETLSAGKKQLANFIAKSPGVPVGLYVCPASYSAEKKEVELEDGAALAVADDDSEEAEEDNLEIHLTKAEEAAPSKGATVVYEGRKVGGSQEKLPFHFLVIALRPEHGRFEDKMAIILPQDKKGNYASYKTFDTAQEMAEELASENSKHTFGAYVCVSRSKSEKKNKVVAKSNAKVVVPPKGIPSSRVLV